MPTGSASGSLTSSNRAARWRARSPNIPPRCNGCCKFAGLDPEHALVRWGNFDRTVLLPSTVFEPDDIGPVVPVPAQHALDLGPQFSDEGAR